MGRYIAFCIALVCALALGSCGYTPSAATSYAPGPAGAVPHPTTSSLESLSPARRQGRGIVSISLTEALRSDSRFSEFVSLLDSTGLTQEIDDAKAQTVFAPTNTAFAVLPATTLRDLRNNPDQLRALLEYHIVDSSLSSADLTEQGSVETAAGQSLNVAAGANGLVVNDAAQVILSNIDTSNGVIYVVDQVLAPPQS